MIIGVDGNEANVDQKVGVSEFAYQLLIRFSECQISTPIQSESNIKYQIYLKNKPNSAWPKESEYWRYRIVKPSKLWTQIGLPLDLYMHKPRPNVFFSPTHYAPRLSPVPTVVSIMDLSYLHYPEMFKKNDLYQLKHWTSYSVKNAAKVITISKSSKDDIIKLYSLPDSKVEVVYPGIKKTSRIMSHESFEELKKKYEIDGNYILFVGTLQPRKNIVRLIEAFSKVKKSINDTELIIIGKKGWMYEEILACPKKLGIKKNVKFLDFVSDEDLPMFYKFAQCFVLPSLYEGFGLPVLEAMSNGCPVIVSNVSSLPEAGGDAALYVDPTNVEDISEKLIKVLTDEKLKEKMIKKGYEQVKKFSWEKSAKEVLDILTKAAGK